MSRSDAAPAAPWRVLADTRRVAAVGGDVAHRWHPATKLPEPVLRPDRPWDGTGAFLYGTVLREGDRLRMWYQARAAMGGGNAHTVAYAESGDGVRWEKPPLGVVPHDGAGETNLTDAVLHLASVGEAPGGGYWAVGHAAAGAASHGVAPGYPVRGVYRLTSEDGFRWRWDADAPMWDATARYGGPHGAYGAGSDVNVVVHDAPRGRFLASMKLHLAVGGTHRRAFATRTSPDLGTWSEPRLALAPDELDDARARALGFDRADFYGLTFHPYPEFVLGFVWVFYMTASTPLRWPLGGRPLGWGPDGRIAEVQPVFSYDGEYWLRPPGRPALVAAGERGAWDAGNVATANQPVVVGDELFHYFGGGPLWHGAHARPPAGFRPPVGAFTATGLARMGRDRYASFASTTGGSVLVHHGRPATAPPGGAPDGAGLRVNARAPHGSVRAALLDASGREVPGFGLDACRPFHGDAVAGEVSWEGASLASLASTPEGADLAVRFVLEDADLFAYALTA